VGGAGQGGAADAGPDQVPAAAGQDLVEYALLVALVAAAAITGIGKVATAVNLAFSNISASIGS
jgi:Flp pilus assembly pilin Flp